MSWSIPLQLNNLRYEVEALAQTSITNPLTAPLNCNQNAFSNLNVISSQAGQPMNLNGSTAVNIPCPLNVVNSVVITNNTVNDCLKINDSSPDTSVFRVDKDGNVGIGVPPASVLTNALTVVGSVSATTITAGNLINSITAGSGLTKTGTTSAPILSWTGYNLNSVFSGSNVFNDVNIASTKKIDFNGELNLQVGSIPRIFTTSSGNLTTIGSALSLPSIPSGTTNKQLYYNTSTGEVSSGDTASPSSFLSRFSQRVPVDISNNNYEFSTTQAIQLLVGGYVYSSFNLTEDRTIKLPNASAFQSVYGSYYSCSFTIMTVPVLIYNIIIDRLTANTGTSQSIFYVNGNLQNVVPFNLGSGDLWVAQIETYIYNGNSYVSYSFRQST